MMVSNEEFLRIVEYERCHKYLKDDVMYAHYLGEKTVMSWRDFEEGFRKELADIISVCCHVWDVKGVSAVHNALDGIYDNGAAGHEEVRGQLGEHLPVILRALRVGLGLTLDELHHALDHGIPRLKFFLALSAGLFKCLPNHARGFVRTPE